MQPGCTMRLSARTLVTIGSALLVLKKANGQRGPPQWPLFDDALIVCAPEAKTVVNEAESGILTGPSTLLSSDDAGYDSGSDDPEVGDELGRQAYRDACTLDPRFGRLPRGPLWVTLSGKRSLKGSVIPSRDPLYGLDAHPCNNATLTITGGQAVAVDPFGQPLEGDLALNGTVSIKEVNAGGLLSAQLGRIEKVSNPTTGYLAERHFLSNMDRDGEFSPGTAVWENTFCSFGPKGPPLQDGGDGGGDGGGFDGPFRALQDGRASTDVDLDINIDEVSNNWAVIRVSLVNFSKKTFEGTSMEISLGSRFGPASGLLRIPTPIVPKGLKLILPKDAATKNGLYHESFDMVVLNKGKLPPNSVVTSTIPIFPQNNGFGGGFRAEGPTATSPQPITITVRASDKSGLTWTKNATITL